MKRICAVLFAVFLPLCAIAQERTDIIRTIVEQDILPGFATLSRSANKMTDWADLSCEHPDFRYRFFETFFAWTRVSHLRFGPSEEENRAFALAFWPDPRGKTPKALRQFLLNPDPARLQPGAFRDQTIAVRGLYALEYLLFDPQITQLGSAADRCALIRAVARDIATTAAELATAWQAYAPALVEPSPDGPYRTEDEVLQILFKSASTGLQFTADIRFGRPLGTIGKPRPKRAEAWRSAQSLGLIAAAVEGSGFLALRLASDDEKLTYRLDDAISGFLQEVNRLDDPALAGVATPRERIRVESLLTRLNRIREIVDRDLGGHLGVISGLNALDGD